MSAPTWLTVAEAARYAALSRATIWDACLLGDLRHVRVGGRRAIRLKVEWIDAWLEQHVSDVHEATGRPCNWAQFDDE